MFFIKWYKFYFKNLIKLIQRNKIEKKIVFKCVLEEKKYTSNEDL